MSISVSVNHREHLQEMALDDIAYSDCYKWDPSEWSNEMVEASLNPRGDVLAKINDFLIKQFYVTRDANQFEEYRNFVYTACLNVLKIIRSEGGFPEDAVFVFAVSGMDLRVDWVAPFNSDQDVSSFAAWQAACN